MLGALRSQDRDLAPLALAGCLSLAIVWLVRAERHVFGLFGPHAYWASLWATDYRDGFVDRGLLGEIIRDLGLEAQNYLVITILAWIVSLALVAVIVNAIAQATKEIDSFSRIALCLAVMMSPAIDGILIETMGDPILLVILVHIAIAPYLLSERVSPILSGIAYAGLGAAMMLVHEASIFFVVPWLGVQAFLVRKTASSRAAFFGNGLTSVVVVGLIIAHGFSGSAIHNPILHFGHQQSIYEGRLAPPFSLLLHEETTRMFGNGLAGGIQTLLRLAGATLLPVTLAASLVRVGVGRGTGPAWRIHALAFLGPAICLGPLMLIAHDWGRFFGDELILFLATASALTTPGGYRPERTAALPLAIAGILVLGGLTTTPALADYRMDGLYANKSLLAASILVIALMGTFIYYTLKMNRGGPGPDPLQGPNTTGVV